MLGGLKQGDLVVTSGSFLVDAETRLNPAAGSIYFGGSGGRTRMERASRRFARPRRKTRTPRFGPRSRPFPSGSHTGRSTTILSRASRQPAGFDGAAGQAVVEGSQCLSAAMAAQEALADPQETLATIERLKAANNTRSPNNRSSGISNDRKNHRTLDPQPLPGADPRGWR